MNVKITSLLLAAMLCFLYPISGQKKILTAGPCKHLPGDFTYDFNACNQLQVNFVNTSYDHKNVTWNFGDGNTGSGDSVVHNYAAPGLYTALMIGRNPDGCIDTIAKQFKIDIEKGTIYFNKTINACNNGSTRLPGDSLAIENCWSPATYLDSADIYDPLINPKSNITYQYNEVTKSLNLIKNGNFENGDSDFVSQYIFDSLIHTNGYYFLTSNSSSWDTAYHVCSYDSSYLDTMMVVNGAVQPKLVVWSKRISVLPNSNYQFSFHAVPLITVDSLVLQCTFNTGEIVNDFRLPNAPCNSQKFRITWYSGADTDLVIKFYDLDTDTLNNAFSLNQISLHQIFLKTDSLTANVVPLPQITMSNNTTVCLGDTTKLSAAANGAVEYLWSPAAGLNRADIAAPLAFPAATTYYVAAVTDTNQCTNKDSVLIKVVPRATVSIANKILNLCKGDSVKINITASNANSFSWLPAQYLSDTSVAQPLAFPPVTTTYFVTAGNGFCDAADSVLVNVVLLPVTSVTNDTSICKGGTLQLSASGGNKYQWFPANGLSNAFIANPVATITNAVKYFVQVADSNNCKATDSVFIAIDTSFAFGVKPASAAICSGDTITLTAFGGNVYNWFPANTVADPSSSVSAVFPLVNTVYKIFITDTSCHVSDSVFAFINVNEKPVVSVSKSNDVDCFFGIAYLKANGGTAYSWQPASTLSNSAIANPVASPLQTTIYYVSASDIDGCVAEDSITVFAYTGNVSNGYLLPSAFTPNGDGKNDCFGIKEWGNVSELNFNIYNRYGNLLFHTSNGNECWNGMYKGIQQPAGTYIYQIQAKTICGNVMRKGTVILMR